MNYIYTGNELISESDIRHYKYLKKIKSPSGKWRYIYDESELKRAEAAISATEKALSDKDGNIRYTDSAGRSVTKTKSGLTITTGSFGYNRYKQSAKEKIKESAVKNFEKRKEQHKNQKIKDIPKRIISRGIGAINKMLYDIEKRWTR